MFGCGLPPRLVATTKKTTTGTFLAALADAFERVGPEGEEAMDHAVRVTFGA